MIKKLLFLIFMSFFLLQTSYASDDFEYIKDDSLDENFIKSVIKEISLCPDNLIKYEKKCEIENVRIKYDDEEVINGTLNFFVYKYTFDEISSKLCKELYSKEIFILLPTGYSPDFIKKYTKETDKELEDWGNIGPIVMDLIKDHPPICFSRYLNLKRKNMFYIGISY